jgi:5S rRNA maturation endonuclease (ribonuclease M5)
VAEKAAREFEEIVVLTDWDRAGEELARKMEQYLQGTGARVDFETRERLKRMVRREIKDVESLSRFVERVRAETYGLTERRSFMPGSTR